MLGRLLRGGSCTTTISSSSSCWRWRWRWRWSSSAHHPLPPPQTEEAGYTIDIQHIHTRLLQLGVEESALHRLRLLTPHRSPCTRWRVAQLFLDHGFTAPRITALLHRRFFMKSHQKVAALLDFLKSRSVTGDTAAVFLSKECSIATDTLKRRIELLESYGLDLRRIKRSLLHARQIFSISDHTFRSRVCWLRDLGIDSEGIRRILRRTPGLFTLNPATALLPKIALLESRGASREAVLKALRVRGNLFSYSEAFILARIDLLQQWGIEEGSKQLFRVLFNLENLSEGSLEARHNRFVAHGFSPTQVRQMLVRNPLVFRSNELTISKKIHYLTKVLNREIKEIAMYPSVLRMSLEKRIIPRFRLLVDAQEKGTLEKEGNLWSIVGPSDKRFQEWLLKRAGMKGRTDKKKIRPKQVKEAFITGK